MEDMKKKALKMLKEKMSKGKGSDMKKVSVISDSEEGLEEGLSLADKILKKKGFACGGKKDAYKNGGSKYEASEGVKKEVEKMSGKPFGEDSDDKEYKLPEEIKGKMSELEKAFLKRKKK